MYLSGWSGSVRCRIHTPWNSLESWGGTSPWCLQELQHTACRRCDSSSPPDPACRYGTSPKGNGTQIHLLLHSGKQISTAFKEMSNRFIYKITHLHHYINQKDSSAWCRAKHSVDNKLSDKLKLCTAIQKALHSSVLVRLFNKTHLFIKVNLHKFPKATAVVVSDSFGISKCLEQWVCWNWVKTENSCFLVIFSMTYIS